MPTAAVIALAGAAAFPSSLTMRQAVELNRTRGFDVRIAELAVASAEGDERASHGIVNPTFMFGKLKARHYGIVDPANPAQNPVATNEGWTWGVSDTALFDAIVGKRWLRQDIAEAALRSSEGSRDDAVRQAAFTVKQTYAQAELAEATLQVQQDTFDSYTNTTNLTRSRFQAGAISEIDLAKIQTAQLEAGQQVDVARQALLQAKAQLAFLMGFRNDEGQLNLNDLHLADSLEQVHKYTPPDLATLVKTAVDHRPDLRAAKASSRKADATLRLAERQRVPDITVAYTYTELGQYQNAITPPTMQLTVSAALPILYQQQGEIARAYYDHEAAETAEAKAMASLANDVEQAQAAVEANRHLVERMEGGLLARAQKARDLTKATYDKGAATLLDFLDAQRTYIASRLEYLTDQQNYLIAVAQLEQAVGVNLVQEGATK